MAETSTIEWTDSTWSPIRARTPAGKVGWHCEHVSPGCANCYAERINLRLGTGLDYKPGHLKQGNVEVFLDERMLTAPLRWRKPRRIFVCSMTDLFADFVTDGVIDRVFAVMALAPQHTFQVLTKRAERMRRYMADPRRRDQVERRAFDWLDINRGRDAAEDWYRSAPAWPLPNCWLSVSAEDQESWNERKDHLRQTPAAVRFVSLEPLLSGIEMGDDTGGWLDWAIVGGESGPGARENWTPNVRSIVRQCQSAGIAAFVKQLGAFVTDRNDAGFDGDEPGSWDVQGDYDRVEEDIGGFRDGYQGAPVRIRLRDRKGGDMAEWPEDLRVRQMPERRG